MLVMLTVKQVLVLFVVIEVPAILLYLVDAELGRINLFGAKTEVIKLASDLAVRLALFVLDPDILNIGAVYDVIPLAVGDA